MTNKFAAIIQTYQRADRVKTYDVLRKQGYTGRIIILIDDTDAQRDEYIARYGEQVVIFDKQATAKTFDTFDNFGRLDSITCARNACFQVAREQGLDYFVELDDDYLRFEYKLSDGLKLRAPKVKTMDSIFAAMIDCLERTPCMSIAFAQGGDFIGGINGSFAKNHMPRKCMNTFFCKTDRPITFIGIMNEDVNTYTALGRVGHLFFTHGMVDVIQTETQSNKGGITELYLDSGTYMKSFYTVLTSPSCVKVSMMGSTHRRIHHKITWRNAVPKIIREQYKKPAPNAGTRGRRESA